MNEINKEKAQRLSSAFIQVFGNPFSVDFNIEKFISNAEKETFNNIYLKHRLFGTGGIGALARVIIIETLNTQCVYYNDEINRINGEKWKVDKDVVSTWYMIEPEMKNIFNSIENTLSEMIRYNRKQYQLDIQELLIKEQNKNPNKI